MIISKTGRILDIFYDPKRIAPPPDIVGQQISDLFFLDHHKKMITSGMAFAACQSKPFTANIVGAVFGPVRLRRVTFERINADTMKSFSVGEVDLGEAALQSNLYDGFHDRLLDSNGTCLYAWDCPGVAAGVPARRLAGRSMYEIALEEPFGQKQILSFAKIALQAITSGTVSKTIYKIMGLRRIAVTYPITKSLALTRCWAPSNQSCRVSAAAKIFGGLWAFTSSLMGAGLSSMP